MGETFDFSAVNVVVPITLSEPIYRELLSQARVKGNSPAEELRDCISLYKHFHDTVVAGGRIYVEREAKWYQKLFSFVSCGLYVPKDRKEVFIP